MGSDEDEACGDEEGGKETGGLGRRRILQLSFLNAS